MFFFRDHGRHDRLAIFVLVKVVGTVHFLVVETDVVVVCGTNTIYHMRSHTVCSTGKEGYDEQQPPNSRRN